MKFKSPLVLFVSTLLMINVGFAQTYPIYIGTYTSGSTSEGVYVYDFNEKSGEASFVKTLKMSNPSFLAKKGNILYAVNEDNEGKVTAYDLKKDKQVSSFSTRGAHPCHVSISPKDPVLVVSNYSSGSLVMYSLNPKGEILKEEDFLSFTTSSVDKERQKSAHIHSAFFSADGKRLFVSDLGGDFVYIYEVQQSGSNFKLKEVDRIKVKLGGGARHVAISKDNKTLYVVLELTGELEVFKAGELGWKSTQILPIYKLGTTPSQGAADIKISKDQKYVYATNRGDVNAFVKCRILPDGKLELMDLVSTEGISPRNINLSKKNKWIFVSNQLSDNVTIFSTQNLKHKQPAIQVPKPVSLIY